MEDSEVNLRRSIDGELGEVMVHSEDIIRR